MNPDDKSPITIFDAEADLTEWLRHNRLSLNVWKTNTGFKVKFGQPVAASGAAPIPGGRTELEAVQHFVWALRGAELTTHLPVPIIVPEFCGIEKAVTEATRTSSLVQETK